MACDKALLTQAYVDGELDPAAALELEAHLAGCVECRALAKATGEMSQSLRQVPRHRGVPPALELRILRALDEIDAKPSASAGWTRRLRRFLVAHRQWLAGAVSGAAFAGAVAAALLLMQPSSEDSRVIDELASAHVRSLMAPRLVDTGSTDRVKISGWFKGRVDVSPPVADLSAQGYDLLGGRVEFIDSKRVAALVYSHGAHTINLFIWSDYDNDQPAGATDHDGYHLVMWSARGLVFCAVSDDSVSDLQAMAKLVSAQANTAKD